MFNVEVTPCLVWDQEMNLMVNKKSVQVQVVGNKGSVFFEAGPLYAMDGQETFQAVEVLKNQIRKMLSHEN